MPGKWLSVICGMCAAAIVVVAGCTANHPAAAEGTSRANPRSLASAPVAGHSAVEHWGVFFGGGGPFYDLHTSPVTVTLPGIVKQIGSSNSDDYALLSDGSVYAWGMGTQGELGDGKDVNSFETPVLVQFPPGVKIAYLATDAMPYDSALAVDTKGHAWGWGANTGGEFCLGNTTTYSTPVRLPFSDVTALAGADAHALYDAGGTVDVCGDNMDGDLGDGNTNASTTPVRLTGLASSPVTRLVAAFANSGALLANGDYYDWGYNADGQLGDGDVGGFSDIPVQVSLPGPVAQVAQGGSIQHNGQTIALLRSGAVWTWGADWSGQLANGIEDTGPDPVEVSLPPGTTVAGLASGSGTSYVMTTTGLVYAWGANYAGQVGNGTTTLEQSPVQVATGASQISSTANNAVISVPSATT